MDKPGFMNGNLLITKLVVNKTDRKILGAQVIGPGDVSKQLAIWAIAIKGKLTVDDMINADLIYRREDINQMSFRGENPLAKQNYSIFEYRGAWNCRHIFKRLIFIKSTNPNAGTIIPGYKKGKDSDGPPLTEQEKKAMDPNTTKVNK